MKNEYWRNLPNQKIPKNPELAIAAVYYLVSKNKVQNQKDLDRLLEVSDYLRKFLYIKKFEELIEKSKSEIALEHPKT